VTCAGVKGSCVGGPAGVVADGALRFGGVCRTVLWFGRGGERARAGLGGTQQGSGTRDLGHAPLSLNPQTGTGKLDQSSPSITRQSLSSQPGQYCTLVEPVAQPNQRSLGVLIP